MRERRTDIASASLCLRRHYLMRKFRWLNLRSSLRRRVRSNNITYARHKTQKYNSARDTEIDMLENNLLTCSHGLWDGGLAYVIQPVEDELFISRTQVPFSWHTMMSQCINSQQRHPQEHLAFSLYNLKKYNDIQSGRRQS